MRKIAIIGAGWYGCHIGATLKQLGYDVTVFERHSDVMMEASGNNQFRLHMGFHYARNYRTRVQSRDGFQRFIERYPDLSSESKLGNIYSVPEYDSLIDFYTYKSIMLTSGVDFREIDNPVWSTGLAGSISCGERVVETSRARGHFKRALGENLKLDYSVERVKDVDAGVEVDGIRYDFLIDCTWGKFTRPKASIFYENTVLGYYRSKVPFPAFTLVDGPLCSIYPTEDPEVYTLSSVAHTPTGTCYDLDGLKEFSEIDSTFVNHHIRLLETHIDQYVPSFRDMFEFIEPQYSMKTKLFGKSDDRSCVVEYNDRTITVMSGKIDTIFYAMEHVLTYIQKHE